MTSDFEELKVRQEPKPASWNSLMEITKRLEMFARILFSRVVIIELGKAKKCYQYFIFGCLWFFFTG